MGLTLALILFVVSLAALVIASDWFISSAEKIGTYIGIPSFVIGVTIVAFGTSLPELATSIAAVTSGTSEIVIGNVIGSNITNILLVLGLAAFLGGKMKIDMPLLFGSAFLLYFALYDLQFTLIEATIFIIALIVFLLNSFTRKKVNDKDKCNKPDAKTYVMLLLGATLVYFGATYTIKAMTEIATVMAIDPHIIALGAVALGTSLPEVVVSVKAAKAGNHGMAIGNVLGSNMFNTFAVMSIPRFFGDIKIPEETLTFDTPFMLAATILFGMICLTRKISKWEGAMLIIFYLFFLSQLAEKI